MLSLCYHSGSTRYTATHNQAGAVLRKVKTGTIEDAVTGNHQDDTYERLAKALGGYNQGGGTFGGVTSWSELVIDPQSRNPGALRTAMEYALDIMHTSSRGIGLPKREYIWFGGQGLDVNGDGQIQDIANDPGTPEDETVTETTVDYCFKFGEQDWENGTSWQVVKDAASPRDSRGNPKSFSGQTPCT